MTDGIFFHLLESSCKRACRIILSIEKSYSLCKMNKGLNFFEKLMRASFQYFSNKLKRIPSRLIRIIRQIRVREKEA